MFHLKIETLTVQRTTQSMSHLNSFYHLIYVVIEEVLTYGIPSFHEFNDENKNAS